MFELAKDWNYLDHSDGNPDKGIKLFKEEKEEVIKINDK